MHCNVCLSPLTASVQRDIVVCLESVESLAFLTQGFGGSQIKILYSHIFKENKRCPEYIWLTAQQDNVI